MIRGRFSTLPSDHTIRGRPNANHIPATHKVDIRPTPVALGSRVSNCKELSGDATARPVSGRRYGVSPPLLAVADFRIQPCIHKDKSENQRNARDKPNDRVAEPRGQVQGREDLADEIENLGSGRPLKKGYHAAGDQTDSVEEMLGISAEALAAAPRTTPNFIQPVLVHVDFSRVKRPDPGVPIALSVISLEEFVFNRARLFGRDRYRAAPSANEWFGAKLGNRNDAEDATTPGRYWRPSPYSHLGDS